MSSGIGASGRSGIGLVLQANRRIGLHRSDEGQFTDFACRYSARGQSGAAIRAAPSQSWPLAEAGAIAASRIDVDVIGARGTAG
jgi:hypothetical protein